MLFNKLKSHSRVAHGGAKKTIVGIFNDRWHEEDDFLKEPSSLSKDQLKPKLKLKDRAVLPDEKLITEEILNLSRFAHLLSSY